MTQWLHKLLGTTDKNQNGSGRNMVVKKSGGELGPVNPLAPITDRKGGIPNASLIYGITAVLLFLVSIYHLFTGRWLTGVLVMFLALCFLGFAWHIAKHA